MTKKVEFVFLADVSGSMYGTKIASVNAVLNECIAELKQIGQNMSGYDIEVSVFGFAESMKTYSMCEKIASVESPVLKVEKHADGFYMLTSFTCLYEGITKLFKEKYIDDGEDGINTFVILITDGKAVDSDEYEFAYDQAKACSAFRKAAKYVGFADESADKYNQETVKFVEYQANRICSLIDLPMEINNLQMTYFTDLSRNTPDTGSDIFV